MQNFHGGDYSEELHQKSHTERRVFEERSSEVTHNKNLHDSFNDDDEAHEVKVQAELDKNAKYRQDLKQQCEDNRQKAQSQYEETRVEMRKNQEAGRSVTAQYEREHQLQHDESQKLHDDIESFKKDCNDYRDMQRAIIELEEQRIAGQNHQISDRSYDAQIAKDRVLKEKDDLNDRMCSQLVEDEVYRQNRERLIDVKREDEDREKIRQEDVRARDKWEDDRNELKSGLLSQIEENKQSVLDEQQRELMFRDQAYAIMEAEEEREKERARKKKEIDDQYYADLRQQIEDNAVRRKKEKELDNA